MRILHIISSADPAHGGPIEGAKALGAIFHASGHQQELLTLDDPAAPWLQGENGGNVHSLGTAPPSGSGPWAQLRRWARYTPAAAAWLKANLGNYDVVVVNGLWNYSTHVARRVLPRSTVPYVVFTHGMLDPWFCRKYPLKHAAKQALWWVNEGVLMRHASRVMFTSSEEQRLAPTFFPWRIRGQVISYGTGDPPPASAAQHAAFRHAVPGLGDKDYFLYLSRIHEKKGCDLLIGAFAQVATDLPGVDLVIAGPDQNGLIPGLARMAERLGIGGRVHFPGSVRGDAKWGAFRGAQAFILPSHQENFGIVVAEAMACETPVLISTRVNIWREVVDSGSGLAQDDTLAGTVALFRTFAALTADERAAMGRKGRQTFLQQFEAERAGRELIGHLITIINERTA
ncbi:MAG: hypothetical protein RLZZ08_112 [Pseudomonadota bacterium]|jgi:glycosyltransferase involved in cell wall biosynthesis